MKRIVAFLAAILVLSTMMTAQGIRVIYPNGGETLSKGARVTLRWATTKVVSPIDIYLEKNGTVIGNIAQNLSHFKTRYSWTVGEYAGGSVEPGDDFKIIVTARRQKKVSDKSDRGFTIRKAAEVAIIPGLANAHDFAILDLRVNNRGKLVTVIKDLRKDFRGPLQFACTNPITRYTVDHVDLRRNVESEVELGDIPHPILAGRGVVCYDKFEVTVNSDRAILEINRLNNTMEKRLPFRKDYLHIFVTVQRTQREYEMHGERISPNRDISIRLDSNAQAHSRKTVRVTVMNCGYNNFRGLLYLRQQGRWGRSNSPHNEMLGEFPLNLPVGTGAASSATHTTELEAAVPSDLSLRITSPPLNPSFIIHLIR